MRRLYDTARTDSTTYLGRQRGRPSVVSSQRTIVDLYARRWSQVFRNMLNRIVIGRFSASCLAGGLTHIRSIIPGSQGFSSQYIGAQRFLFSAHSLTCPVGFQLFLIAM